MPGCGRIWQGRVPAGGRRFLQVDAAAAVHDVVPVRDVVTVVGGVADVGDTGVNAGEGEGVRVKETESPT